MGLKKQAARCLRTIIFAFTAFGYAGLVQAGNEGRNLIVRYDDTTPLLLEQELDCRSELEALRLIDQGKNLRKKHPLAASQIYGSGCERWILRRPIASTYNSEIWLAEPLGCNVHRGAAAIKFINRFVVLPSLIREDHAAEKIRQQDGGEGFLPVYFTQFEAPRPLIVFPYGGSVSFQEFYPGAVPLSQALSLIRQLLEIVARVHRAGVSHLDIKPSNILVGLEGQLYLIDFGLARFAPNQPPEEEYDNQLRELRPESSRYLRIILDQTSGHAEKKSKRYRAPEQRKHEIHRLGPWTDVYSLGKIFEDLIRAQPLPPRLHAFLALVTHLEHDHRPTNAHEALKVFDQAQQPLNNK